MHFSSHKDLLIQLFYKSGISKVSEYHISQCLAKTKQKKRQSDIVNPAYYFPDNVSSLSVTALPYVPQLPLISKLYLTLFNPFMFHFEGH